MPLHRRDLLKAALATPAVIGLPRFAAAADGSDIYDLAPFGSARILHMTDTHAQLVPVYFREPSINIGVGAMRGRPPHLVGEAFLKQFGVASGSADAYAFTFLDFAGSAKRFGRMGGFAHLKTLVDRLRAAVPAGRSLLLDGGDLWQGSGLANAMQGADMVQAANLLGIDAMTGHWEFTYGEKVLRDNLKAFKGEFLAQNVFLTEEAAFNDAEAFDKDTGRVFKPYIIREMGDHRVAIIGQAFPYVPIAHPRRFTPDWTFGVRDDELQKLVNRLRDSEKVDAVVLLSHNGMDVDLKLASRITGIDVILGGHTHDAVPQPVAISNAAGRTLVTNAGSNGKFVGVLDLDLRKGGVKDVRYRLLPVFSERLKADADMAALIAKLRAPHAAAFDTQLATADRLLFRRGNFNGSMDELICDALRTGLDAEIALSPGFRWGPTVLAGAPLTMGDLLGQTAMTYPEVYVQPMTGEQLRAVMEDVCDNLFNLDPYYQQGGDMVRLGGLAYSCAPAETVGRRISDLRLASGAAVEAGKTYKVAGWASVNEQKGAAVWDTVAAYLCAGKPSAPAGKPSVTISGVADNPGYAAQG
ncbi:thiosulfohydrolase SoxB [Bradyrhizobium sp. U87765 SZCCT0131]|uniref:thiosulfohydrolase SoxB n=1 Tax=unclassified Bradyrhizobium TaxID=2631580 RepID=UPI001BA58690|nr:MULTISPECIES: thiosulfohydrolase SoxB [unclassified Bradyrhizobium]MBR1217634.1 thiosulfohydrolase SoxB [Bradyrhizobium sp. U87765 SZCCT0131]MBR1261420.1 thiosulfohydrolase SoxB [Bradyrhizobium sp. U87765 SZCCT0134]MBR1303132.1 thiosulfohydrolase SoxB [Bradyrhizobium sp. U87765 SZCCT0110]MBR1318738.1 thiosulfohydrolase SoxB [Bradyrhizobium sp. U87765 SZCCT0109]MBR1347063.1 thiosulfohydrolase SoxB [Bradyrhizobium sp. U87765 SZCCT0048]